MFNRGLNLVYT